MMKNILLKVKEEKGITLVALVVTIIVLLILAGIAISLTVGNNGLFSRSKTALDVHSKEAAREKLEIALSNLELDKNTKEEYDSNGYLEEELGKEGIIVIGNIAIVDEWQFEIDRNVLKIVLDIGKGQESNNIKIDAEGNISKDYVTANVVAHIDYEGTISNISINGKEVEVPEKQEGIYTINEEVEENGTYTILAKDEEDNYKIKKVQITELTEDMEIWNKGDLVSFREKVNSGRTFEKRTARVMADVDLQGNANDQWIPIGNDTTQFKGTFEGNYHIISNLYVSSSEYRFLGMFSRTEVNATIQNVIFENVYISNSYDNGTQTTYVGAIVGESNGNIINCGVNSGNVIGKQTLNYNGTDWGKLVGIGGVVGRSTKEITNCYNKANVKGEAMNTNKSMVIAGGIASVVYNNGILSNCYNQGSVNGTASEVYVGGIIGKLYDSGSIAQNSYNKGNISGLGNVNAKVGGIIGINGATTEQLAGQILNCYCTTLTRYSYYYWNGANINNGSTEGRIPEDTLKTYSSQLGDAFTNDIQNADGTWKYNNGYPILKWQLENE